jgi:hypothetical protein
MADYYPLIARAVAGLDANATGENRRALYERARTALIAQLRGVQPPLSESDITRERLTLEEAIRKVESEAAQRARAASRGEAAPRGRSGDALRASPSRTSISSQSSPPSRNRPYSRGEQANSGTEETVTQPDLRSRPEPPRSDSPRLPSTGAESPRRTTRPGGAPSQEPPLAAPPVRERAGMAQRRSAERGPQDGGLRGFRDVVADADELGGAAAQANRAARRTFANVPSPTPEFDRLEPDMEDRSGIDPSRDRSAYGFEDSPESTEGADQPASRPTPDRKRGGKRRAAAPRRVRAGFPIGRAAAVGVILIVVGALIAYWPNLRSLTKEMFGGARVSETAQDKVAPPANQPKITDRVGQPSSSSATTAVAQRVVLYDEDPAEPQGKQYVGTVVWHTEPVAATATQPADVAVRADLEIPDRKLKMTFYLRRNSDSSLPASHTIELTFMLPPDFAGGGIANVPGVLMKSNEQTRGTPLAGSAVKVTNDFFLVGLSNIDADRSRNLQLLKERGWFDIPLVYSNQRRAIIAIEKGSPGERAFADAFAAWGQ